MKTLVLFMALCVASSYGATRYVALDGGNVAPYTNWCGAATSIQTAVDACVDGDTVIVSNGVYGLSTELSVLKNIRVASAAGPYETAIDGMQRTRCLSITNGTLTGFTICNGFVDGAGAGAGVNIAFLGGVVENCIVRDNVSTYSGGVECNGYGKLRNCLIFRNRATNYGAGVRLRDGGTMENCTVVSNTSSGADAGLLSSNGGGPPSIVLNSIISLNAPQNYLHISGNAPTFSYTCIVPSVAGTGNITAAPLFADATSGNYRLRSDSPCVNAGLNQP